MTQQTLDQLHLKVFTACLRNAIFEFAMNNNYIDCHLQKGFLPKIAGTYEHTAHMAHIINHARLKQRQVVITLLDLKNAFGEVHHNLIKETLNYHHVPDFVQSMIGNLYTDFQTSISTKEFNTAFVPVKRGVLQGDCLSPLVFNLCFNTFLQYVKSEQFTNLGYRSNSKLEPRHWFQFADDASVVTSTEQENQILLSAFARWCSWADMIIRVDKCMTFGMKKFHTASKQYKPKLLVNKEIIPAVEIGASFKYLGRHFNYEMNDIKHQEKIMSTITDLMHDIDKLPLHPRNKTRIYQSYVLSKLSWHFSITDISVTWVKQNVDNVVNKYLRRWMEIPVSGTLDICMLSKKQLGLNIIEPSTKFTQCQTVLRLKLKSSPNDDIKQIHQITSTGKNIQYDSFNNTREIVKEIRNDKKAHISTMKLQNVVINAIWDQSHKLFREIWPTVQGRLPKNIFNFTVRYVNNSLPTRSNLHLWGLTETPDCTFCGDRETLKHVVATCKHYLDEKRFNWRHDSILLYIAKCLSLSTVTKVYVDIAGYPSPEEVIGNGQRPDLVLIRESDGKKSITVLELTAGFESNLASNFTRKNIRYNDLVEELKNSYDNVEYLNLSLSAIGFICNDSAPSFLKFIKDNGLEQSKSSIIKSIIAISIRCSYFIFCRRNKDWDTKILLEL